MRRLTLKRTIILIVFMAIFAMAVRVVVDTDVYWHLATGRYISQAGIPQGDPFSFTKRGQPWVDIQWLPQLGFYLIYTGFGLNGLMIVVALGVVAVMFFVWKQLAGGVWLQAGVLLLTAIATSEVWTARPHLLTFLFVAILGYVLTLYQTRRIDRLWLIPFLFLIWGNVHGGYIVGFMLIGSMIIGEAVQRAFRIGDWRIWHVSPDNETAPTGLSWIQWRKLTIVTFISVAALLVNPYTLGAIVLPFKTVGLTSLQSFIAEWASPNFHDILQQPMIWLLLLTLCAIGWSGRRLAVADAAALVLFAYISFLARRNIGLFAVVCAPILTRHAAALIEKSRWGQRSVARGFPALNAILIIMVAGAVAIKIALVLQPALRNEAEARILPIGAVNWLEQHRPGGAMFNSYNWGGYLIWRLGPNVPVFVDGRTDLYEDAFLNQYRSIVLASDQVDTLLDQYRINFIVIEKDSALATYLAGSAHWQVAYEDEQAVIFTRRP